MNRLITPEQEENLKKQRRIRYLEIAITEGWILFKHDDEIIKDLLEIKRGSRGRVDLSTVSDRVLKFANVYWEQDSYRREKLMEMTDETFYKD